MIKNCQEGFKPIQFLSLDNGKAISVKYPDSLRARETAPVLVTKLRNTARMGIPYKTCPLRVRISNQSSAKVRGVSRGGFLLAA